LIAMREIVDGLFHWKAMHPNIGTEVGCHFVGSGTAIDPLLPDEGVEWFERSGGVERVVLSNRHHLRHAPELAERFGCPILCHKSGLYEFEDGPGVAGFAFGDRLAEDVVALEMDAICSDDTVLHIEAGGGALLFADGLIHYGRCTELLERFEHLLFAHGDPLLDDGPAALRTVAEGS
jgi:hypothetical protein